MVLDGFNDGISVGSEFQSILRSIAATIPTVISASWINWIIVKYSITLPMQYLLQMNTFIFSFFRLKCCTRAVRGGGPGGPLPFRIYVDSCMVLLCLFALAPASPLVAPFAFLYFLVSTPMLRRNVIYLYRPKFDGGGIRWPFIFDMIISSIFFSQILLSTMMALKKQIGPAILAAIPFVPTLLFRDSMVSVLRSGMFWSSENTGLWLVVPNYYFIAFTIRREPGSFAHFLMLHFFRRHC
jgi:hypothetical protein